MRIAVSGSKDFSKIIAMVKQHGIETDNENPDFVITYGGDGSILYAERDYPGVPKITVRASETAKKCMYDEKDLDKVLEKLKAGKYKVLEEMKIEAEFAGNKIIALNDFQVRSGSHVRALRFSVFVNKKQVFGEIIGDGAVIATPFGSGAYYSSVGGKAFKKGIGIALNNPHDFRGARSVVAGAFDEISVAILRDHGILLSDNCEKEYRISPGDEIAIRRARETAKFVAADI